METDIEVFLENVFCRSRSIFAFIGSPLRGDDRLGLVLYDEINVSEPRFIRCEYGLENCLNEITDLKPEKLVIIDAVYSIKHDAGDIVLFEITDSLENNFLLSTHSIPLNIILKILRNAGVKDIYVLGVVVKKIELGLELSREVLETIKSLTKILRKTVSKCPPTPKQ